MTENTRFAAHILKTCGPILSDEHMKTIYESVDPRELHQTILNNHDGGELNSREIEALIKGAGDMEGHKWEDSESWDDDTLNKYADYVQNYKYTYKDEATQIDPNIDTQQEHIGPMAQDLEKVNPAVVQEDPKTGYKTVDTGRLALMNAGAIADLARELKALKNV